MTDPAAARHERVSEIVAGARRLDDSARDAFVRDACHGDPELRDEALSLLGHGAASDSFLDPDSLATRIRERAGRILAADAARLPEKVGGHHVVGLIGEGAMGVVYEAEQENPRRRVALKVLRRGLGSAQHLRRFEREVALLARLNHPGIARVHAAGIDESDALGSARPWFTMELVLGVPFTTAARREGMTRDRKIELLALTCEAVAHAHAAGIVHRDLKPANILVDDAGQPHVLDFGIAVAAGADDFTRATRTGDVIGTLNYMSPEQATGNAATADARADVHALGVMGFEMLTGRLPFDLDALPLPEVVRRIAEHEPPGLGEIDASLRGGPSAIIAKALEKDPARRYADAGQLAADLRRLLADEPILAQPITVTENLRRAARRHRAFVAGSLATIFALAIGLAIAVRMAVVADRAREEASLARVAATQQRDLARDRLYESLLREARALRVNRLPGYRRELFDRLRQAAGVAASGWNAEAIRTEASLCLGDPVSREPVRLVIPDAGVLPEGRPKSDVDVIDATGSVVAHGTSLGLLQIFDAATGVEIAKLEDQGNIADLAFVSPARLLGILAPADPAEGRPLASPRIVEWQRDEARAWAPHATRDVPGVARLLDGHGGAVAVVERPRRGFDLIDLASGTALGSVPLPPLALAADRRRAALRSDDGESVALWDLAAGAALRTWRPGLSVVESAVFNEDGGYLACQARSGVAVFETARGETLCAFRGYFEAPGFVDRTTLALPLSQARTLRLVNVVTNNEVTRIVLHGWRHRFAKEVVLAISTGEGRVVQLGDTPERRRLLGHAGGVPAVAFTPDGRRLLSAGKDTTLRAWDLASGTAERWEGLGGPAQALSVSPDGRFLATAEWEARVIRLWSMATGRPVLELDRPKGIVPLVTSLGFSADGRRLAAVGSSLQVWEIDAAHDATLAAREIVSLPGQLAWSQALSAAGERIAYSSPAESGAGIDILRVGVEGAKPEHVVAATGSIQSIAFSPRDGDFAFIAPGIRIELIDPELRKIVRRVPTLAESEASPSAIGNLSISPDGRSAAVGSASSRGVNVVDLESGRRLFALPDAISPVWWLAWSPDGTRLAVSTSEGEVSVWDLAVARSVLEEARLWEMEDPRGAAVSPDHS